MYFIQTKHSQPLFNAIEAGGEFFPVWPPDCNYTPITSNGVAPEAKRPCEQGYKLHQGAPYEVLVDALERGAYLAVKPSTLGALVLDVDEGNAEQKRALAQQNCSFPELPRPVFGIPSSKADHVHLWYAYKGLTPDGKREGNGKWWAYGCSGEVRYARGYIVIWEPDKFFRLLPRLREVDACTFDDLQSVIQSKRPNLSNGTGKASVKQNKLAGVVQDWQEGSRSNTLNATAYHLVGQGRDDELPALQKRALESGLTLQEIEATVAGAQSRAQQALDDGSYIPNKKAPDLYAQELAEMFCKRNDGGRLYVEDQGWFVRERLEREALGLWDYDPENLRIRLVVSDFIIELRKADILDKGVQTSAVEQELRSRLISNIKFNVDPDVCGLPDGRVLDLKTGQMRPALEHDYISKRLSCVPEASKPVYFLKTIKHVCRTSEQEEWLHRFLGHCLTGHCRDNGYFLFLYGAGDGGKSTFTDALSTAFGFTNKGYGAGINGTNLVGRKDDHLEWVERLDGKRLAIVNDLPDGQWKSEHLKPLVTGDLMTARGIARSSRDFRSSLKVIIAGNKKPRIPNSDDTGFSRRMVLIPIPRVPDEEQIDNLTQLCAEEAPQILNWLVEGARKYYEDGMGKVPYEWVAATKDYFASEDVFAPWCEDRVSLDPQGFESLQAIKNSYNSFTGQNFKRATKVVEWLILSFGNRGVATDTQKINGKAVRGVKGITLNREEATADPENSHDLPF